MCLTTVSLFVINWRPIRPLNKTHNTSPNGRRVYRSLNCTEHLIQKLRHAKIANFLKSPHTHSPQPHTIFSAAVVPLGPSESPTQRVCVKRFEGGKKSSARGKNFLERSEWKMFAKPHRISKLGHLDTKSHFGIRKFFRFLEGAGGLSITAHPLGGVAKIALITLASQQNITQHARSLTPFTILPIPCTKELKPFINSHA